VFDLSVLGTRGLGRSSKSFTHAKLPDTSREKEKGRESARLVHMNRKCDQSQPGLSAADCLRVNLPRKIVLPFRHDGALKGKMGTRQGTHVGFSIIAGIEPMTSYCMLAATKREYNCDPMILWYHGTEQLKHCLSPFTPSFPQINQEPKEDAKGRLCSNSKTKLSILLLCPHLLILEWIWRRQALANLEASHLE
jgi:hypothetical protein